DCELVQIAVDFGEKRDLVQRTHFPRQINEPINFTTMRMNGLDFHWRLQRRLYGGGGGLPAPTKSQNAGNKGQEERILYASLPALFMVGSGLWPVGFSVSPKPSSIFILRGFILRMRPIARFNFHIISLLSPRSYKIQLLPL